MRPRAIVPFATLYRPLALTLTLALASCGTPKPRSAGALIGDPNLVSFEGATANRFLLAEEPGEMLIRLRVATPEVAADSRPPLNLALLIDTSGSMEGAAIENARRAALAVVDSLRDGDRLAVVAFHSKGEVVVPSSEISTMERAAIAGRIGAIEARGTTSMVQGLDLALREVSGHLEPGVISRVVLLSDGIPNQPAAVPSLVARARQSSIPITALGFGLDYDESLLTKVAQGSGGGFHYIEEPDQVAKVFVDEVTRMQRVVAQNMRLDLQPGPGWSIAEVLGAKLGIAGGAAHLDLGDLSQGEQRDIIVRLSGRGRADGANVELLDAVLSFNDAVAGAGRLERRAFLAAHSTGDRQAIEQNRDASVELSAARAAAAAATVRAVAMARANQLSQAQDLLTAAEKAAREAAKRFDDDAKLIELIHAIDELREALPNFVSQVNPRPAAPMPAPRDAHAPAPATDAVSVESTLSAPEARRRVNRSHSLAVGTLMGR